MLRVLEVEFIYYIFVGYSNFRHNSGSPFSPLGTIVKSEHNRRTGIRVAGHPRAMHDEHHQQQQNGHVHETLQAGAETAVGSVFLVVFRTDLDLTGLRDYDSGMIKKI